MIGGKLLGVDVSLTHTTAQHVLGSVVRDDTHGKEYVYVLAAEAIAAGNPVDWTTAFSASVTDSGDIVRAVAPVAIASGSYGFVQTKGAVSAADAATDLDANNLFSWVADANGRLQEVPAETVDSTAASGLYSVRGISTGTEAANSVSIVLF